MNRAICCIIASCGLALVLGPAAAAQMPAVNALSLERGAEVSRLVVTAEAPFKFQVELTDPRTVLLRLPNLLVKAEVPDAKGDPVVASISVHNTAGGARVLVRTRRPGVTVLPLYDAAGRRLTLELGGAASQEVAVARPMPRPAPAQRPAVRQKAAFAPTGAAKKAASVAQAKTRARPAKPKAAPPALHPGALPRP